MKGGAAMAGDVGPWVLGGVMALLALLGLGLASRAQDYVVYGTGLGLFVFCVLVIFYLIHRNVGRWPAIGCWAGSAKSSPPAVLSGGARAGSECAP